MNMSYKNDQWGEKRFMSHSTDSLLIDSPDHMPSLVQTLLRAFKKLSYSLQPMSISELLIQLKEVTTPQQLTKVVNRLQYLLWKLPTKEQTAWRKKMMVALTTHVLEGTQKVMRLEAAGWLRLLLQAGLVAQPEDIFVTLVTAATSVPDRVTIRDTDEIKAYLKLIFECFWPFRYPYPAFSWQAFPKNQVFYPLAPLFNQADYAMQDALIGIFSELPTLDDGEILEFLLPVALKWAEHADAEHRRRITNVLARIDQVCSQRALQQLLRDTDPLVRENAKSATGFVRRV